MNEKVIINTISKLEEDIKIRENAIKEMQEKCNHDVVVITSKYVHFTGFEATDATCLFCKKKLEQFDKKDKFIFDLVTYRSNTYGESLEDRKNKFDEVRSIYLSNCCKSKNISEACFNTMMEIEARENNESIENNKVLEKSL